MSTTPDTREAVLAALAGVTVEEWREASPATRRGLEDAFAEQADRVVAAVSQPSDAVGDTTAKVARHVYDGERCQFCGSNVHDVDNLDLACVPREPIAYTSMTKSAPAPVLDGLSPLTLSLALTLAEDRADDAGIDIRTLIPEAQRLAAIIERDWVPVFATITAGQRDALVLHLWDEGIVRPEHEGARVVDAVLAWIAAVTR